MVTNYARLFVALTCTISLIACSMQKKIGRAATKTVLQSDALKTAHVGISIYEPATGRYWYNYQGDHYFVPASNAKILTCYAALKYLDDSITGLRYGVPEEAGIRDKIIVIQPTGDPTFLHRGYFNQPAFNFLKDQVAYQHKRPGLFIAANAVDRWAPGWSWDDYLEPYMAERSSFPIFGNTVSISLNDPAQNVFKSPTYTATQSKRLHFTTGVHYFDSLLNKAVGPSVNDVIEQPVPYMKLTRDLDSNIFQVQSDSRSFKSAELPFVTYDFYTALQLLSDTLKTDFSLVMDTPERGKCAWYSDDGDLTFFHITQWHTIHTQPTDSVLRPMLFESDNFLAEQSLLMVSQAQLGVMNDQKIRDTLLKTDFKDLPQKPRWEDGSGLSRYNLFTPQDFVFVLNKMQADFTMQRLQRILPTGGQGTLRNYFRQDSGYVFAKTGSMSGVMNVSGYLYTRKNKLLLFSILINNQQASAATIRRTIETFVHNIRMRY